MQSHSLKLLLWIFLTFSSLHQAFQTDLVTPNQRGFVCAGSGQKSSCFFFLLSLMRAERLNACGRGAKCSADGPTLTQTQVGFGNPPKFRVEVHNNCPMCPVIDIHVKCGNFSQALVAPRFFKVLGHNDCVLNAGLPLPPLQKFSFNYSHQKYPMKPSLWHFQCE